MTVLADLIRFTTPTKGTGDLTVGMAVPPFMTPAQYGGAFASGVTPVFYSIIDVVGGGSETGSASYNATTGKLTGRTVKTSTNANAPIACSGLAQIAFTAIANAIVNKTGDTMTGPLVGPSYTVALLPAGSRGARAFVTDASAAVYAVGATVTGGGSNTIPVYYNDTAWVAG